MPKASKDGASGKTGTAGKNGLSDDELARRRQALDEKLRNQQEVAQNGDAKQPDGAGFANALRLSTEFVAGILVGTGIGWGIDKLAGSSPLGMIVGLLLGFCAGVLNVLRSAKLIAEPRVDRGSNAADQDEKE